jgi:hypothetical protein
VTQETPKVVPPPPPARRETPRQTVRETPRQTQQEAPRPAAVTLAVGTTLTGTLKNTVSTEKAKVGDVVELRTTEPVVVDGRTAVPTGSTVHGTVTHVRAAGRFKGAAELTLRFTELELPSNMSVAITCEPLRRVIKGDGKQTAAEIGGAGAAGGVLGGVLGGDKNDVLKGAAIGAAVGTGVAAVTKGEQVVLPAGKTISVTLSAPVTWTAGPTS